MRKRVFGAWLMGCVAMAEAAEPQLHGRIASKQGPAHARQWTLAISGDGQAAVTGVAIQAIHVSAVPEAGCRPAVKGPTRFPLAVGDLPAGGTVAATVTLDFSGCPNQTHFNVHVKLAGDGGVSGVLRRKNEYR